MDVIDILFYVVVAIVILMIGWLATRSTIQKVGKIICAKDEDGDYFMLQFYDTDCIKTTKNSAQVVMDVTRIK